LFQGKHFLRPKKAYKGDERGPDGRQDIHHNNLKRRPSARPENRGEVRALTKGVSFLGNEKMLIFIMAHDRGKKRHCRFLKKET